MGKAESALFEFGESEGDLYVEAILGTQSVQDATDMITTLQGLSAMARLMTPKGAEGDAVRQLLGSVSMHQSGNRAELSFEMSVADVAALLESVSGSHGHDHGVHREPKERKRRSL